MYLKSPSLPHEFDKSLSQGNVGIVGVWSPEELVVVAILHAVIRLPRQQDLRVVLEPVLHSVNVPVLHL